MRTLEKKLGGSRIRFMSSRSGPPLFSTLFSLFSAAQPSDTAHTIHSHDLDWFMPWRGDREARQ